ncbi:MAG: SAM-dependent methyltransferase [Candidatus Omnitrophica bacterium]|nr:SAM-dependent methyltransferase [Candidatus Omnitrophota bacterium]
MHKLYLIPNTINDQEGVLFPIDIVRKINDVRNFFVEEPKSARRFLKRLNAQFPFDACCFYDLNEHTNLNQIAGYITILQKGDGAIISEAGCPCVADPGADLVLLSHQHHIDVIPLTGPCSIVMALMASGLSGQNFAFNGYLPRDHQARIMKIKMLEERSLKEKQTQIFMETPYRNQYILDDVLKVCKDKTYFCVACSIGSSEQIIKTMNVKEWKKNLIHIDKKPALFLIDASSI